MKTTSVFCVYTCLYVCTGSTACLESARSAVYTRSISNVDLSNPLLAWNYRLSPNIPDISIGDRLRLRVTGVLESGTSRLGMNADGSVERNEIFWLSAPFDDMKRTFQFPISGGTFVHGTAMHTYARTHNLHSRRDPYISEMSSS